MKRTYAVLLLLGTCIVLVLLLLTETVSSIVTGLLFAGALLLFGLLSRGFTTSQSQKGNTR